MSDLPKKPVRSGPEYQYHRAIRQGVARRTLGPNPRDRFTQTRNAVLFATTNRKSIGGGESTPAVQRFKITGISNLAINYLVCVEWDGVTEGDTVNVALPREFWGGTLTGTAPNIELTRTVTTNGVSGVELLTPKYQIGNEIIGIKPEGKTSLVVASAEVEWVDANVAARAFRFPRRVVEVCVGANLTRRMLVYGSEPVV